MIRRSAFVAAAAFAALCGPARAADGAGPVLDEWTRFYAGGFGGGSFVSDDRTDLSSDVTGAFGPFGNDVTSASGLIGLTGGYDRQIGPWVVGVALDVGAGLGGSEKHRSAGFVDLDVKAKRAFSVSLAPRVGRAFGSTLFYATGGVELARLKYDMFASDGFLHARLDESSWKVGFVVGAGIETKLTSNLSMDIGYRYSGFGRDSITSAVRDDATGAPTGEFLTTKARLEVHAVRLGLNYGF